MSYRNFKGDPEPLEKRKMMELKKCDEKQKNLIVKIFQNYSKLIMTSQTNIKMF